LPLTPSPGAAIHSTTAAAVALSVGLTTDNSGWGVGGDDPGEPEDGVPLSHMSHTSNHLNPPPQKNNTGSGEGQIIEPKSAAKKMDRRFSRVFFSIPGQPFKALASEE